MKNKKIIVVVVLSIIIVSLALFLNKNNLEKTEVVLTGQSQILKLEKEAESYLNGKNGYDIQRSETIYYKILEIDPLNERALYQSARVHYIQGQYDDALEIIEKYKSTYPEKKRIYYISGLVNAYAKNLDASEADFKEFVKSDIVNEAGFLDLAWVQFQKGDFKNAKTNLEKGIEITSGEGNTWLNSSMGAVLINLDQKEEALVFLQKAKEQSEDLNERIWAINYSTNDAKNYKKDIEKMKSIIDFNISIAKGEKVGEGVKIEKIGGLAIEALSPNGKSGGYAVSACCASAQGKACGESPANVCGDTVRGSVACDGKCSIPPAPPAPWRVLGEENSVCRGTLFTQEQCKGANTRERVGTLVEGEFLPRADGICKGKEFFQIRCGEERTSIGTRDPGPLLPRTDAYCKGTKFIQTNCSGEVKHATGTKVTDDFFPAKNTVCRGTEFKQTNCAGDEKIVMGTDISGTFLPHERDICDGRIFPQEKCGDKRFSIGTKDCTNVTKEHYEGILESIELLTCAERGTCSLSSATCSESWPANNDVDGRISNRPISVYDYINNEISELRRNSNDHFNFGGRDDDGGGNGGGNDYDNLPGDRNIFNPTPFLGSRKIRRGVLGGRSIGLSTDKVCEGTRFLQSKCSENRVVAGIKDCDGNGVIDVPPAVVDNIIDIECSTDKKVTWNNCSSTVKLSFQDKPFYMRMRGNLCPGNIGKIGVQYTNKNLFLSKEEAGAYKVKVLGLLGAGIFTKDFYGVCGNEVISKKVNIKVLNVDTKEI